jgi:membrane protein implicated in regulation of membrane protease activity
VLFAIAILLAFLVLPSPWGIIAVVIAALCEGFELALWRRVVGYQVRTGAEAMVGMTASVVEECAPRGRVRLRGELWNAEASRPARIGETVVVRRVNGLWLEVDPATEKGP